jgi:hypothetical protein
MEYERITGAAIRPLIPSQTSQIPRTIIAYVIFNSNLGAIHIGSGAEEGSKIEHFRETHADAIFFAWQDCPTGQEATELEALLRQEYNLPAEPQEPKPLIGFSAVAS